MRYLLLLVIPILSACAGEAEFEGKLFCTDKKAYVIRYHAGRHLYRFDKTPVADAMCAKEQHHD